MPAGSVPPPPGYSAKHSGRLPAVQRHGVHAMQQPLATLPSFERAGRLSDMHKSSSAMDLFHDGYYGHHPDSAYDMGPMSMGSVPSPFRPRAQLDSGSLEQPGSPALDLATAFSSSPPAVGGKSSVALSVYHSQSPSRRDRDFTLSNTTHTPFLTSQLPLLTTTSPIPHTSMQVSAQPDFQTAWQGLTPLEAVLASPQPMGRPLTQPSTALSLWASSSPQHRLSRPSQAIQIHHGAASNHDAVMKNASTDAWPQGDTMSGPMQSDAAARQIWLDWHGTSDRHSSRASVGQSGAFSDLVGLMSGPMSGVHLPGVPEHQISMGQGSEIAPAAPPVTQPPVYCPNCTLEVNDEDEDTVQMTGGSLEDHLTCPHCHHPVITSHAHPQPSPTALQPPLLTSSPAGSPHSLSASPLSPQRPAHAPDTRHDTILPPGQGPIAASLAAGLHGSGSLGGSGTVLGYDDLMLAHREPPSRWGREHPERPARLTAIMQELRTRGLLDQCHQIRGRAATDVELESVHDPELSKQVAAASAAMARAQASTQPQSEGEQGQPVQGNPGMLMEDPSDLLPHDTSRWVIDCPVNEATAECARVAAGTAIDVTVAVATRRARNGAAIIRPPGHHAESALSMGFCIYNNAAVAARAAQKAGAHRVAIIDWDVHYGNGTAHAFYEDPSVLFLSSHRWDRGSFFPGTGAPREAGTGSGIGHTVNVGWCGSGITDADCLLAFRQVIMPIAAAFRPDLVIVSAGFDAARGDPLGGCLLSPALYGHLTQMVSSLAPTVLLLEGGYNLAVTAQCTAECVRVLLGGQPEPAPEADLAPTPAGVAAVMQTLEVHAPYWPVARQNFEELQEQQELLREQEELREAAQNLDTSAGEADLLGALLDDPVLSINQLDLTEGVMKDCDTHHHHHHHHHS